MKIQFLTSYYPPFLDVFYQKNPDFNQFSYAEMLDKLLSTYFADTGAAHHHMVKHGLDSNIIIVNCEPLQKQWAAENQVPYSSSNWAKEIAFEQVKSFQPDVFYLESVFEYFGQFVNEIRPHVKKVISWISTPFSPTLNLSGIDLFLSSTQVYVDVFKMKGFRSEYFLPAFDARVLDLLSKDNEKNIGFSFVGGWSNVHVNRKVALNKLISLTPLKIWGYGYEKKYSKREFNYYKNLFFQKNSQILNAYQGEVWGLPMYEVLKKSLITFNIHEDLLNGAVGNMRMFEATGVGTMVLNDNGCNLATLFEPGKEIESYNSIPEAVEKVSYYSEHPEKAVEIGRNAQKRTLKEYNYDLYAEHLIAIINKLCI